MAARLAVLLVLMTVTPCAADCESSADTCETEHVALLQAANREAEHESKRGMASTNVSAARTTGCGTDCSGHTKDKCKRVFIIRHGERKNSGTAELNECGWERAWEYSKKLGSRGEWGYNVDKIYAFNYEQSSTPTSKQRAAQTASYLSGPASKWASKEATAHHIHWGTCTCTGSHCAGHGLSANQNKKMADRLYSDHLKTILVFWEHANIKDLLYDLTGKALPTDHFPNGWQEWDFDSYLIIYYPENSPHHCEIKASSFGIHPAVSRGDKWYTCPACHEDGEPSPYCKDRSSDQKSGGRSLGRCP